MFDSKVALCRCILPVAFQETPLFTSLEALFLVPDKYTEQQLPVPSKAQLCASHYPEPQQSVPPAIFQPKKNDILPVIFVVLEYDSLCTALVNHTGGGGRYGRRELKPLCLKKHQSLMWMGEGQGI